MKYPIYFIDFEGNITNGINQYGIIKIYNKKIISFYHGTTMNNNAWNLFSKLRKKGPFASHNSSIEYNLLKKYWPFCPKVKNFFSKQLIINNEWGPFLDTYLIYKLIYPNLVSYKLLDLINLFNLKNDLNKISNQICNKNNNKPHNALFDAIAGSILLIHQLDIIKKYI